jgi:hypothetical protein
LVNIGFHATAKAAKFKIGMVVVDVSGE